MNAYHSQPSEDLSVPSLIVNQREVSSGIYSVVIGGTLDGTTFADAQQAIQRLFDILAYEIIVDCEKLSKMKPVGLAAFLDYVAEAREHGGDIIFVNVPAEIRQVFTAIGLGNVVRMAESNREAMLAFQRNR